MLGALEVRADSGELPEAGGSRLRALPIMLALRPGQAVCQRGLSPAGEASRPSGS
jgi:hypothetical protein